MPRLRLQSLDRRALLKAGAALAGLLGALPRAGLAGGESLVGTASGAGTSSPDGAPFMREIAPGVHAHMGEVAVYAPDNQGDVSNFGFVVGRDAVAVVDTGGSAKVGARLHAAIRSVTDLPIRYVINTHMHPDHVFGNAAFEGDQPAFVAHHKMARGLAARAERYIAINKDALGDEAFAGTKIVMPTRGITEPTTLDLGGRSLLLSPQKTAHTDNDLIVRDSTTDTVFLGDLVFAEHVPTLDGSIVGWLAVLDTLSKAAAARVVPGHGPASMAWPDAARPIQHYLTLIATEIRAMIKDNRTLTDATEEVGTTEKNAWKLFGEYHIRNVSAAFAELEWE